MEEHFSRFRKKVWIDVTVKCLLIAFAAAFVTVNAVLLPCELNGIKLLWVYYVLIALAAAGLAGGIAFLCLKTDDKKIAMRLDRELGLDESVQTALEFAAESGDMLVLQREKTAERLSEISARSLRFSGLVLAVACAVLCVLGTVAIPVTCAYAPLAFASDGQPPKEPVDPIRKVTDWEWSALDDLINYVSASKKADAAAKSGMLAELNGLKNVLLAGVTQNSLSAFVQNTVTGVRNAVSEANVSASKEQKELNSAEGEYVVNRLYEIFALKKPSEGLTPGDPNDPNDPDKSDDPSGGNTGTGELNISDIPFFDGELGYVKMGEVRDAYYERVQNAFAQGLISREEWEYIMLTYFADMSNKDKE